MPLPYSAAVAKSSLFQDQSLISFFYMIYDRLNEDDPCSFTCFAMNKSTGKSTDLAISLTPDTKERHSVLLNCTAVAVGTTIYMIGGYCPCGHCPGDVFDSFNLHAEVRIFNALRPEDGWRDVAPMHFLRVKPATVIVDGMIYVFGGSVLDGHEDGECYDPNTNKWHRCPGVGFQPSFACIQAPYVDPNGAKRILVHYSSQDIQNLYMYLLDAQKWEIVSRNFHKFVTSFAVVGDIIYVVRDNYDEKQPLQGYHLIHKRWFPIELPENIEICTKTAWVFASGSDRLCLVWYKYLYSLKDKDDTMECLELRLNESYTIGSNGMISATKVSSTYFHVKFSTSRRSILAL